MTDPAQAAADLLSNTKNWANEELIRFLNGLSAAALHTYPDAEVQTWPYQKAEAEAVIAADTTATLDMAPLLSAVCQAQFGDPTDDAERLQQVKTKAAAVKANADSWSALAAYINGLRARVQAQIEASSDPAEISTVLNDAKAEAATVINA